MQPYHNFFQLRNEFIFNICCIFSICNLQAKKEEGEVKYKRGVIMVSHLPHGFFEDELKGFFSQFGKVLRVRVGRSPKVILFIFFVS